MSGHYTVSGCLLCTDEETPLSPILILDNLEKVNMASIFGPLLDPLAHRGIEHAFSLTGMFLSSSRKICFTPLAHIFAWTLCRALILLCMIRIFELCIHSSNKFMCPWPTTMSP